MKETNRKRLRGVAERVRNDKWGMDLLTELRAEEDGGGLTAWEKMMRG